jgi:ketosteroid isomerase-like protein
MSEAAASPRTVLDRYYQAIRDKSPDDLADLYAADAVHEFPFTAHGLPAGYTGREEVRAGYQATWGTTPADVKGIRDITVYETGDPEVLISRQVIDCALPDGTAFAVPGLLIMRVRDGLLTHVADYVDGAVAGQARPATA